MKYCKKCIIPNMRPRITFNEDGNGEWKLKTTLE